MKNDRFLLILRVTCHFCALCFFEGDTKEIIRRALKNSHFLSGSFYICIFRLLFLKSSGVAKKSAVNKSTNSGKRHDLCHNLLFQFHNSFYIYCERCKIHLKGHGKQPS